MARAQRSVEKERFWRAKLAEQRRSGLNVRAFCSARAISEPSFYAWRRALKARDAEQAAGRREKIATGNSQGQQRLIPVEIVSARREPVSSMAVQTNQRMELVTPGGFTLRFAADASSDTLARVLDLVAQHDARHTAKGTFAC